MERDAKRCEEAGLMDSEQAHSQRKAIPDVREIIGRKEG